MITGWEIYWITRLDAIIWCFILTACCLLFVVAVGFISADCSFGDREKRFAVARKRASVAVPIAIAVAFLAALIPTTNQAVAIYMIPKIANNEQVQKIPDNAAKFLNTKLEAWINETLKEKEKK